jgi:hypothetical protein
MTFGGDEENNLINERTFMPYFEGSTQIAATLGHDQS